MMAAGVENATAIDPKMLIQALSMPNNLSDGDGGDRSGSGDEKQDDYEYHEPPHKKPRIAPVNDSEDDGAESPVFSGSGDVSPLQVAPVVQRRSCESCKELRSRISDLEDQLSLYKNILAFGVSTQITCYNASGCSPSSPPASPFIVPLPPVLQLMFRFLTNLGAKSCHHCVITS